MPAVVESIEPSAAVATPAESRVVLDHVSWSTWMALLDDVGTRRGRMAYDRGMLEIMSPSVRHENAKTLLGRLFEAATEELDVEILSAGSLTMKREDLARGIEPDECYYVARPDAVRGKPEIELPDDPPPDLAFEVDITRSSIDKLGIYAALGVREVWRYDGRSLSIRVLGDDGGYQAAEQSQLLPRLPVAKLAEFLALRHTTGETTIVRSFRSWLREQLGP